MSLTLYDYPPSVYCQIVRMALLECGQDATLVPVDPFADPGDIPHPFGQVPVLCHDGFTLYETTAILRYLDVVFAGGRLTPADLKAQARMGQVQAIVDAHGYWPLVRKVYSHRVFRPMIGLAADEAQIHDGLSKAETVLGALNRIAAEGLVLTGPDLTLADIHLAPMVGFFTAAPEGDRMLSRFPDLCTWWHHASARDSYRATRPDPPTAT
jgi:glutathione S-transferase